MHSAKLLAVRPTKRIAIAVACMWSVGSAFGVDPCSNIPFRGFDSRLHLQYLGRLPSTNQQIVGFEVVNGRPVVAYEHQIVALNEMRPIRTSIPEEISALGADQNDRVWLETKSNVVGGAPKTFILTDSGLAPTRDLDFTESSILHDSGSRVLFESRVQDGVTMLSAIQPETGDNLYLAPVHGKVGAISWNRIGLAFVAGNGVYAWTAGGNDLVRLRVDDGFSEARDIALIGPDRVVVALQNYFILITDDGQTVIVGFTGRCRFSNGVLYLLDEQGGFVWALRGIEKLGTRQGDEDHARSLIEENPANATPFSSRYLEAQRIVGCDRAKALRAEALQKAGSPLTIQNISEGDSEPVHDITEPGLSPPIRKSSLNTSVANGDIGLALIIGADGAVRSGEVLTAPTKAMGNDALLQARQWQYDPAHKNGVAVAARIEIRVSSAEMGSPRHDSGNDLEQGLTLLRSGKYLDAITAFNHAISSDPNSPEPYFEKGLAIVANSPIGPDGKALIPPTAGEALRKYLQLSPAGEHAQTARDMLASLP